MRGFVVQRGTRLAAQRMRSDLTDYPRVARLRLCNRGPRHWLKRESRPLVLQYTGQTCPALLTLTNKVNKQYRECCTTGRYRYAAV